MKKRITLIIGLMAMLLTTVSAQEINMRQLYEQAENDYKIGRIERAKTTLANNIVQFPTQLKTSGYRLLSLCSLALDEPEQAEQYAAQLLELDPYYSVTSQDPLRFADMVNNIKSGKSATITTASSQAETLAEVPVPTTLITEEMIRNCGAQNLQGILAAYVPGMHIVDCNDDINIAMRGIYSNGQEKILFMINGHRMNSYCTNIAAPDFSISLEKIRQIEVLRGPASSLYGGVALTAVVNIITKQGGDIDGVLLKAGVGNYGQLRGDMIYGKRYFDLDLLIWGGMYMSKGEKRHVEPSDVIYDNPVDEVTIGHIGDKPSYDFGLQMKWKNLQFLYETNFSQVVAPFGMTTLAKPYQIEKYRTFNGISPSFATNSHHADISYQHTFGKVNLKGTVTYDNSDLTHYQVIYDYPILEFAEVMGFSPELAAIFSKGGVSRYINGQEYTYGAQIKGDYSYINKGSHKGFLSFGVEYSHFQLTDVRYQLGYDFKTTTPENSLLQETGKGHEDCYNAFIQLKHQWKSLIFNAGLRYDHKRRYDESLVNEFSPRVALILLRPKWDLKLSLSKSFVDAPYLYRKTNDFLPYIVGDESEPTKLNSETVHSLQLTFAAHEWFKGFNFEVNAFYNRANDLIITHILNYKNGGLNKSAGLEMMANYRHPKFTVDFNLSLIKTFESKLFDANVGLGDIFPEDYEIPYVTTGVDDNNNTPYVMSNAVLSWQATKHLKLHTHLQFTGRQTTYNTDIINLISLMKWEELAVDAFEKEDWQTAQFYLEQALESCNHLIYHKEMTSRFIVNLGAEYQIGKFTLGLNIHNLLNHHYFQSGMNTKLVPQKGRWFMASVAYNF